MCKYFVKNFSGNSKKIFAPFLGVVGGGSRSPEARPSRHFDWSEATPSFRPERGHPVIPTKPAQRARGGIPC
jgi:hypothetical protein